MTGRPRSVRAAVALLALAAAWTPVRAGARTPTATVDCSQSADHLVLTTSTTLDRACTWTGGIEITASGVTLDCGGATVARDPADGGVGILVRAPEGVALQDVTVQGCRVEGFLNGIRVTRDGFRSLAAGSEYDATTARIAIQDNEVTDSRGVGIFIDGYVSDVTVARNQVKRAGSSGIYLDGGSRRNTVTGNVIGDNGFRENGPGGQQFTLGGKSYWFWGVGREGLSLDGSSENTISDNRFFGNSAGGLFVYKNCGEFPDSGRYFERRTPSEHNLIDGNTFTGGRNGVWIGSRMAENTLPMACTDPAYIDEPARRVVLDRAAHNTVVDNHFQDVTYGIRVEDDDTVVEGNTFDASSSASHAVIVGTPLRAEVLHRPVVGTVLAHNVSTIHDNPNPYRWIPGESGTVATGNQALGRTVGVCEAPPVPRQPFIFVIAVQADDGTGTKPPTPDLTVPTLGALPACDRAAASSTTTTTTTTRPAGETGTAPGADPVAGSAAFTG